MADSHAPDKDLSLHVLQLQCIVEAKDRELELLRKRLAEEANDASSAELAEDAARLRRQVSLLESENAALRSAATNSASAAGAHASGPEGHLEATHVEATNVTRRNLQAGPASASGPSPVDPGALVDKLRGLVGNMIAEALATRQQAQPPQQSQPQQRKPEAEPVQQQLQQLQHAGRAPSQQQQLHAAPTADPPYGGAASILLPPGCAVTVELLPSQRAAPAPPVAPAAADPAATATQHEASSCTQRAADAGAGDASGGPRPSTSAPEVLELNVDGAVVYVARQVLEEQAAGSRLYSMLVTGYGTLPRDSQGRPYLSYDPRVFQVLLSFLKERHLFGAAAAACDWPRIIRSLGVAPTYVEQVAAHFGVLDVVSPPRPAPTSPQQRSSSTQLASPPFVQGGRQHVLVAGSPGGAGTAAPHSAHDGVPGSSNGGSAVLASSGSSRAGAGAADLLAQLLAVQQRGAEVVEATGVQHGVAAAPGRAGVVPGPVLPTPSRVAPAQLTGSGDRGNGLEGAPRVELPPPPGSSLYAQQPGRHDATGPADVGPSARPPPLSASPSRAASAPVPVARPQPDADAQQQTATAVQVAAPAAVVASSPTAAAAAPPPLAAPQPVVAAGGAASAPDVDPDADAQVQRARDAAACRQPVVAEVVAELESRYQLPNLYGLLADKERQREAEEA